MARRPVNAFANKENKARLTRHAVLGWMPRDLSTYKTKFCRAWARKRGNGQPRFCPHGNRCWYAHDNGELRTPDRQQIPRPCPLYREKGDCYFSVLGLTCCFSHAGIPSRGRH
ncbi:OLC1v1014298C1 [Oldenlandia corymbosa var. corymbosa]|uniref:OLC1v1014298C1 n=1 Tax=Oldenlandia corymbosa var. corymbosa TaxID=529605 RepID=A0AAV1E0G4_OLDCO|nr:OLC1v1014298C1 [Oldenlandia corymbosa var. corymbosa]